ncbi:hypothetical protein BT246_71150 (plasmid) [Bacillus thuringiensis]|uniref:Uncharacterized protein n=1 Tax=Bacillus thuringiensis TaxID=1428 RepID=A0A9W3SK94_BACTU|nr:hypothetical protein BT246_71150 [Bacillus thuringiensis]
MNIYEKMILEIINISDDKNTVYEYLMDFFDSFNEEN